MILLDTSFLIALKNIKDTHFTKAQELQQELLAKKYGPMFLSDYIFDEFVTFLRMRLKNQEQALLFGDLLLQDKDISLIGVSKSDFQEAWGLFKLHQHLSFTDATSLILLKKYGFRYICSFDSDFDRFPSIKRIM